MPRTGDYSLFLFRLAPEVEAILRDVDRQLAQMEKKRTSGNTDNKDYEYSLVLENLKEQLVQYKRTEQRLGEEIKRWVNSSYPLP